jgi:hypothetical protein
MIHHEANNLLPPNCFLTRLNRNVRYLRSAIGGQCFTAF